MRKSILILAIAASFVLGLPSAFAQALPDLTVRVAEHASFDRIVFDWPKSVKFKASQKETTVTITFEEPASVKFPSNIRNRLRRARNFSSSFDEGSATVSFSIPPAATIKTFTNGTSIVVDVQDSSSAAAKPPAKTVKKEPPPAIPDTPPEVEIPPEDDGIVVSSPEEPSIDPAPSVEVSSAPLAEVNALSASPLPPTAEEATAPQKPASSLPVARVRKVNDFGISLGNTPALMATLDPRVQTRAAIFLRGGFGYIIFDRKMTLSLNDLRSGTPSQLDLKPLDLPKNSGYAFPVPPEASLQATSEGTAWKIYLSKRQEMLSVTSALLAQPDFALGARLLLPLSDIPEPIRFSDPVVGDDLILVPLSLSQAFNTERKLPDLTILPAAQGLVIKPLSDKVFVRPVSDGIEITAEGGLLLSRTSDTGTTASASRGTRRGALGKSIFDFSAWRGKPGETFTQTRQRLQQTIVDVPEAERNRARMELARFYFSRGRGEEAVSLLTLLSNEVPDLKFHSDFMALLGAAKILAYRSAEGLKDLSIPELADQPEVSLWQAVGLAQLREWQLADDRFSTKQSILAGYPDPFFSRFFVLAIESALASNQVRRAAEWLNFLSNTPHLESVDPAIAFLRGTIEAEAGHAKEAEKAWKEARKSNNRLYKVRAELALTDLNVSNGSLTPAQAADRLEALRFGWRGDDLEADILRRLGQFYIQAKNVKVGINILSRVASLYPSSSLTPTIRAEMAGVFRDIFLENSGEKLPPLDALTLYRQYRDMMPSGDDRDTIMDHLAERLVSVDLLDQAAELLEDLTRHRFQAKKKEQTALRLAAIRLLDHKPAAALTALDLAGEGSSLSAKERNERVLLRARALSELDRNNEAYLLLRDNPSSDALLLRADISMRAKKWDEAAKVLTDLVGPPPSKETPFPPNKADWLVNAAIAYALGGDQISLDRLAIDYSEAMAPLPQNATFLMLTQPEKMGQFGDISSAQAHLTQVDLFRGFLDSYRKSVQSDAEKGTKQ